MSSGACKYRYDMVGLGFRGGGRKYTVSRLSASVRDTYVSCPQLSLEQRLARGVKVGPELGIVALDREGVWKLVVLPHVPVACTPLLLAEVEIARRIFHEIFSRTHPHGPVSDVRGPNLVMYLYDPEILSWKDCREFRKSSAPRAWCWTSSTAAATAALPLLAQHNRRHNVQHRRHWDTTEQPFPPAIEEPHTIGNKGKGHARK